MSIKEKEQKLQRLIDEVCALEKEIKTDKKTEVIQDLRERASQGIYISKLGKIWHKFSAKVLKDRADADYPTDFFLTDLEGNYISDKVTYEGQKCTPGWAVRSSYCPTEQTAIDYFEQRNS